MECKKVRCSHFHPRQAKRNTDMECKFKEECNRTECKFKHPTKTTDNVKVTTPVVDDNNRKETVPKVTTPVADNNKEVVVDPHHDSNQVFHKGKEDSPQIEDLKKMISDMSQNVNLLMQERMYWNWGHHQYYQQQ